MQPTYLHQYHLPTTLPTTRTITEVQPISDGDIDRWLIANRSDAFRADVAVPGFLFIEDTPSDQVLCYLFVIKYEVCRSSRSSMAVSELSSDTE
jgi:hypothetical protein